MKGICGAFVTGGILAFSMLLMAGCNEAPAEVGPQKTADFILKDLDGVDFQLSSSLGKVVLLNFFNATCGSCQLQTVELVELHHAVASQGLVVVGISHGPKEQLESFVDAYDVPYRVLRDTTQNLKVWNHYQGDYPTPGLYLIDKNGIIDRASFDQVVSAEALEETIQPLL